jgi:hypothetical protein
MISANSILTPPISTRYNFGNRILNEYNVFLTKCNGVLNGSIEEMKLNLYLKVTYRHSVSPFESKDLESIRTILAFNLVEKPIFSACTTDQNYILSKTYYYGVRFTYSFGIKTLQTSAQLTWGFRNGYAISIIPNPNNMQVEDTTFGNVYLDAPTTPALSDCATLTGTLCNLKDHIITVYSLIQPNISDSCTIKIKLDNFSYFTPKSTSGINSNVFLCEIGTTFTFDFSTLVNTNSETPMSEVSFYLTSSVLYGDFTTSEITLNANGVLNWSCREIIPDFSGIYYPLETPDITIFALSNKFVPKYLLTFNIKPYRRPIISLSLANCRDSKTPGGTSFFMNKDYNCQLKIRKCTNASCISDASNFAIKYLQNLTIYFSPNPSDAKFKYTIISLTGYIKFRYVCETCSADTTIPLTIYAKDSINWVSPSKDIISDQLNITLLFKFTEIPKIIVYDGVNNNISIPTFSDDSYTIINTVTFTNIWVSFGSSIDIWFLGKDRNTNASQYSYKVTNSARIENMDIINKPVDMFLIEENSGDAYRLNYTSKLYNDLDLQVWITNSSFVKGCAFFRIKTYYNYSIDLSTTNPPYSTLLNKPLFIRLIPVKQVFGTQEIRMTDVTLTLTSQKICTTLSPDVCRPINLVYKLNVITGVFYFYADLTLSAGNFCKYYFNF